MTGFSVLLQKHTLKLFQTTYKKSRKIGTVKYTVKYSLIILLQTFQTLDKDYPEKSPTLMYCSDKHYRLKGEIKLN